MEVHYISGLMKKGCLTMSGLYFAALDELPGAGR